MAPPLSPARQALIVNSLGHVRERRRIIFVGGQPGKLGQIVSASKDRLPLEPRRYVFLGERNGTVILENIKAQPRTPCRPPRAT